MKRKKINEPYYDFLSEEDNEAIRIGRKMLRDVRRSTKIYRTIQRIIFGQSLFYDEMVMRNVIIEQLIELMSEKNEQLKTEELLRYEFRKKLLKLIDKYTIQNNEEFL